MAIELRQSTAGQEIPIGYFVDSTDGNTEETGLTIANTDIKLWKWGATTLANKNSGGATHISNGIYYAVLDATDTNTLGPLVVFVHVSGALAARVECAVITANQWDSKYSTDALQVDVIQVGGTTQTARDIGASVLLSPGTGTGQISLSSGAVTAGTVSDKTGYSLTATTGLGNQTANITGSITNVTGGINTAAGTIQTLDALDTAQDTQHATTQSLVSALSANTGVGLARDPDADNSGGALNGVTLVGTIASGTFADLGANDGTYVQIDDATNVIDYVVRITIPVNAIPTTLLIDGYVSGVGDSVGVYAYEFDTTSWDLEATMVGQSGTTNNSITIPLGQAKYVSSGVVYVRFTTTAGANQQLNLDRVIVGYQNQSVGYAGGQIWIDTNASNTNTIDFEDGVADNPVSTIAAANTLNTSLGLNQFYVRAGSSITFAASQTGEVFSGEGWTLALGGQDVSNSHFFEADVSGTGTTASGNPDFHNCNIGTATIGPADFHGSHFGGTLTGTAGDYFLYNCHSNVAGTGSPAFAFGAVAGATNINVRNWFGGSTWTLNSSCTLSLEVTKGGTQTVTTGGANVEIRAFCKAITVTHAAGGTVNILAMTGPITINGTGGTVNVYGQHSGITDNSSGSVTINDLSVDGSAVGTNVAAILADTNELQTDWTNGGRLDLLLDTTVAGSLSAAATAQLEQNLNNCFTGTASGTPTTTTMISDIAVTVDDQFKGRIITFDDDTTTAALRGQSTDITACTAASNTLTFTALTTAPSSGDTFVIT